MTDQIKLKLSLGSLVDIGGWCYVVVHESYGGRVQLCRRGSERWMKPIWVAVSAFGPVSAHTRYVADARRSLAKAGFDADGWRRIPVGSMRHGSVRMVQVDHESMQVANAEVLS